MEEIVLSHKELILNTKSKTVCYGELKLDLTKKEYGILEYLMVHKEEVVSAETLIEHVWDSEVDLFSNTFKFHMSSLRKKLMEKTKREWIRHIRGIGYQIEN